MIFSKITKENLSLGNYRGNTKITYCFLGIPIVTIIKYYPGQEA